MQMYRSLDSETSEHRCVEQILAQGLSFFACILEHPGIWDYETLAEGG